MKTTTRAIAAIMLMFAAVLVAGCTKDNYSHDDENTDKVTINPEYVPIDWETATVTTYDDSTGDYTIQFASSVPDIHPGSVIAIDRDTVVLYRFVLTANTQGNTVNITTTEAYLTDIFSDTEFTLSTATEGKSQAKGIVFHPVEAYILDDNGGYQVIDMKARKDETHFTHNLWHYGFNHDGHVIHAGSNDSIVMDQMNMDLDIDLEMYMNFGGRNKVEFAVEAVDRYMSKAMEVNAALVGRFNTEQMIRCKAWGSSQITSPSFTLKQNVFPPASIKFMAGPVPVILVMRSDLCCKAEVSTTGEIQAYTGFSDHAEGRMGFNWSQAGGITPVSTFENAFSFTPPTLEGKGEINAKLWAYPQVSVFVYDIVGPSFDLMPYSSHTLRGGFREQMLGQTNDYCAWSYDHYTGLDFCCGLSFNIFGHQLFNDLISSLSTPTWNVVNIHTYHSPKKVVHASGRPQGGQTATVRFDVYDQDYLFNREVKTTLWQIVKFEASGDLSSEYGIARDGTVQVNWTPNGSDTLWAKLYDQDGNLISFDTVIISDWVDLGLPSGLLWATRNVGASSPTDYGNYYAWGETSPKSVYDWSTYRYFRSDVNGSGYTKYCNNSSYGFNGFTDGLTTLQAGDDAATANYGGHTPTKSDWEELINNTSHQWVTINGVRGMCFTGRNGNSLFLPASGSRYFSNFDDAGSIGRYWSSSLGTVSSDVAGLCIFGTSGVITRDDVEGRVFGFSVRAVRQP